MKRHKFFKQIIWGALLGICLLGFIQAQNQDANSDLKSILHKIERNKTIIKEKKVEKKVAEKELGQLARELKVTEFHLERAKKKIVQTQGQIQNTKSKLTQTQRDYNAKVQRLSGRVRDIYKNKSMGALEFVFAPSDFMSAVDAAYYFERIMKSDMGMLEDIKANYSNLVHQTKQLENQNKTLTNLHYEIKEKEEVLESKKMEQQRYIQGLRQEIAEMERVNQDLERASNEITNKILASGRGQKASYGSGRFIRPANGWISSMFGFRRHPIFRKRIMHRGVDISAPTGTSIRAADSGYVIVAGQPDQYRGYGKITIIDHGMHNGKRFSTIYAHQSRILVQEGEFVKQGQEIGLVGSTGHSTGPHLHFEVRIDGITVNPLDYTNF